MAFSHSSRSKDDRMRILYGKRKKEMLSLYRITEPLWKNVTETSLMDKLKAYTKFQDTEKLSTSPT